MKDYILKLDKDRELRYGFRALRMLRDKFGDRSLDQMMDLKVDEIPILIWAGLKGGDKSLTIEQVEDLLDEAITEKKTYTIMEVTSIGLEALASQMGVDLKKLEADDQKKKEEKPTEPMVKETLTQAAAAIEKKQPTKTTPSTKKQKK